MSEALRLTVSANDARAVERLMASYPELITNVLTPPETTDEMSVMLVLHGLGAAQAACMSVMHAGAAKLEYASLAYNRNEAELNDYDAHHDKEYDPGGSQLWFLETREQTKKAVRVMQALCRFQFGGGVGMELCNDMIEAARNWQPFLHSYAAPCWRVFHLEVSKKLPATKQCLRLLHCQGWLPEVLSLIHI